MPQELPPEDYFRLCINDCWTADLAEPYVLVYDFDAHVAVALDDLLVLKGPVLDHEQPGQWGLRRLALPLITQNRRQCLLTSAIEWLKQHRYGKSYQLTEEGIFKFKRFWSWIISVGRDGHGFLPLEVTNIKRYRETT